MPRSPTGGDHATAVLGPHAAVRRRRRPRGEPGRGSQCPEGEPLGGPRAQGGGAGGRARGPGGRAEHPAPRGFPAAAPGAGGQLGSTTFAAFVATLRGLDTEGPELQTGASRSAARGHPVRLVAPAPSSAAPADSGTSHPWANPRGDPENCQWLLPHIRLSVGYLSIPQTAGFLGLKLRSELLGPCRQPVLSWWIAASCRARNPTSRAISQYTGSSPDIPGSSPGPPRFPTSGLTGHPQDRLR